MCRDLLQDPQRVCLDTDIIRSLTSKVKKTKEDTSSSESGLHFGHYKAGAQSILVSHFHALKTSHFHAPKSSLALKRDIVLTMWSRGLSVMLEKMSGYTFISKLRAILLIEADFNFANKTVYGV